MMRLLAFSAWFFLMLVAQHDSAPVNMKKKNNNNKHADNMVAGSCDDEFNDMMRELRYNWDSPLVYLKHRGYIPRRGEQHIEIDELQQASQTCSAPRTMKSATGAANKKRQTQTREIKGLLAINNLPDFPVPKIILDQLKQDDQSCSAPRKMKAATGEANKNRDTRAGAIKGLLDINNPPDPPVQKVHEHPKGMAMNNSGYPYAYHYNNYNNHNSQYPYTEGLAKEGKSFLKHIKDKIVGLFKGNRTNSVAKDYTVNVGSLNTPSYSAEDFDREFESLLSQNYKGHYDSSDDDAVDHFEPNEFHNDLDKVINKKFDKVSSNEYNGMQQHMNDGYLNVLMNKVDKDANKVYANPVLPQPGI